MIKHLKNNVVGYLALVVALSGTSYAAVQLQAGQVKTKHLANQAVTSKKIKDGTIAAKDVKGKVLGTSRVVARGRFAGSIQTTGPLTTTPLTGATWTQARNELTSFVVAVTFTSPQQILCGLDQRGLLLRVKVDDDIVLSGFVDVGSYVVPGSYTRVFEGDSTLFEPGVATTRTLSAQVSDNCQNDQAFTVTAVKVDAIGVR